MIQPLARRQMFITKNYPNNWGYILGKDFLVYPILNDAGVVEIDFPAKSSWIYYFNTTKVYKGKTSIEVMVPLDQSPIFMRNGSVIPTTNKYTFVYPEGINGSETIYNEEYSDEISYSCANGKIEISVTRYYRTERASEDVEIQI